MAPNPIDYANDADGLKAARHEFKKRYDSWVQRRRRAIAAGETVAEHAATVPPMHPPLPQPAMPLALATEAQSLIASNPNMVLMIPASMVSLLATQRPPPAAVA